MSGEDGGTPRRRSDGQDHRTPRSSVEEDRTSPRSPLVENPQTGLPAAEQDVKDLSPGRTDCCSPPPDTAAEAEADTEAEDQLTHRELETVYRDTLAGLLTSDPLLSDLQAGAALTAAEVRSLTALERGTAMAVLVNRGDRLTRVIVQRSATVRDLKAALRSAVELELARRGGRRRSISWRYVWRSNWLAFQGRRLKDDDAALAEIGLGNRAEVCFVKRIRAKRGQRDKKGGQV